MERRVVTQTAVDLGKVGCAECLCSEFLVFLVEAGNGVETDLVDLFRREVGERCVFADRVLVQLVATVEPADTRLGIRSSNRMYLVRNDIPVDLYHLCGFRVERWQCASRRSGRRRSD